MSTHLHWIRGPRIRGALVVPRPRVATFHPPRAGVPRTLRSPAPRSPRHPRARRQSDETPSVMSTSPAPPAPAATGVPHELTPAYYHGSTLLFAGAAAVAADAVRSVQAATVAEISEAHARTTQDLEAVLIHEETTSLLTRHSGLICRFVESELDTTSPHDDGLGRQDGTSRSAEVVPRLGAEFRDQLRSTEAHDAIGCAVEDLVSTAFLGAVAATSAAAVDRPLQPRPRPLDVTWRVWHRITASYAFTEWPNLMQGFVAACGEGARERFLEQAAVHKLERRLFGNGRRQRLESLAMFYAEAGVSLYLAASSHTDQTAKRVATG